MFFKQTAMNMYSVLQLLEFDFLEGKLVFMQTQNIKGGIYVTIHWIIKGTKKTTVAKYLQKKQTKIGFVGKKFSRGS